MDFFLRDIAEVCIEVSGAPFSYTTYGRTFDYDMLEGNIDAEVVEQQGSSWTHLPQFTVDHIGGRRDVQTWMGYHSFNSEGMILGTSGRSSVFRARVTNPYYSPAGARYPSGTFGYVRTAGLDSANCGEDGDSGAAVWRNNSAAGLLSGASDVCTHAVSRVAAILGEFDGIGLLTW